MNIAKVKLKERSYDILIGSGIIADLGEYLKRIDPGDTAYVITNNKIKKIIGSKILNILKKSGFNAKITTILDTERSKSFADTLKIINDIARYTRKKHVFIIALGGGVVGDLSGFIASVYKRGIPYVQIPTSLLAQVDSSIGGKTAIDLREGKNLVGAFYQPRLVLSDINILKTLAKRQIKSGISEVIKYAIIQDKKLFNFLEMNKKRIISIENNAMEYVVSRCSKIKASIVSKDEYEKKGLRTVLNFGHTIGHAIETASGYKGYNHGEAVALGMLVSCQISMAMGLLKQTEFKKIESLIKEYGLPTLISNIRADKIINAHYYDKKFKGSRNKFVLVNKIGGALVKEGIPFNIIRNAINERLV